MRKLFVNRIADGQKKEEGYDKGVISIFISIDNSYSCVNQFNNHIVIIYCQNFRDLDDISLFGNSAKITI